MIKIYDHKIWSMIKNFNLLVMNEMEINDKISIGIINYV